MKSIKSYLFLLLMLSNCTSDLYSIEKKIFDQNTLKNVENKKQINFKNKIVFTILNKEKSIKQVFYHIYLINPDCSNKCKIIENLKEINFACLTKSQDKFISVLHPENSTKNDIFILKNDATDPINL